MNGRSSTALSETQGRSNSSLEWLPNLPVMSERITYSTHTPAVFFVFDGRNHSGTSTRGTCEDRVRISHDHDHAHHGAAKIIAQRLRAEVQEFRSFIGQPKLRSAHR